MSKKSLHTALVLGSPTRHLLSNRKQQMPAIGYKNGPAARERIGLVRRIVVLDHSTGRGAAPRIQSFRKDPGSKYIRVFHEILSHQPTGVRQAVREHARPAQQKQSRRLDGASSQHDRSCFYLVFLSHAIEIDDATCFPVRRNRYSICHALGPDFHPSRSLGRTDLRNIHAGFDSDRASQCAGTSVDASRTTVPFHTGNCVRFANHMQSKSVSSTFNRLTGQVKSVRWSRIWFASR